MFGKMKKTVFVFGAGSTSALGLPTSEEHMAFFEKIDPKEEPMLGKLTAILAHYFGKDGEGHFHCGINDVFNLIDSNLLLHNGLYCEKNKIEFFELEECKKEVIRFLFSHFLKKIKENQENDADYRAYVDFYYQLAKAEIEHALKHGVDENDRSTFISRYSIINFNWDLYSLLPIFEANAKLNHENGHYFPIRRNPNLRIFTDFNCEYASKGKKDEVWYPFTEPAAHIVNSEKYESARRVVLTKCYYPHGAMNLFKCPNCAKHSYFLGDLTVESVARSLNFESKKKTEKLYNCPHCSSEIRHYDFDILPQSNFKTRNAYLESVRLSMINELRNADRLFFIGYSMPTDDVDNITLLKSLNHVKEVYVTLYDKNGENKFLDDSKLNVKNEAVERFHDCFRNKEKVLFNMAGVPTAFDEILKIYKE